MNDNEYNLLLIEDNEDDTILLLHFLQRQGMNLKYKRVETLHDFENALETQTWDLIISDFNLIGFTGLEVLRIYNKKQLDIPFIVVSGAIGEETAVSVMKAGAHDFIMKANLARLSPAIERELREAEMRQQNRRSARTTEIQRQLGIMLGSASDLQSALSSILNAALEIAKMDCGGVFLAQPNAGGLVLVHQHGFSEEFIKRLTFFHFDSPQFQFLSFGQPTYAGMQEALSRHDLSHLTSLCEEAGVRSIAILPIIAQEQLVACLCLVSFRNDTILQDTQVALETMVAQIGNTITRLRAEEDLRKSLFHSLLLNRIITLATSTLDEHEILTALCRELAQALDLPQAAFARLDESGSFLTVEAEYGCQGSLSALGVILPVNGNEATQYVLTRRLPLIISNAQKDDRQKIIHDIEKMRGTVSLMIIPVIVQNKVIGTLGLDALEEREFTQDEVNLAVSIATAASISIEKASLYHSLQNELDERRNKEIRISRQLNRLRALQKIDNAIANALELRHILKIIVEQAVEQLQVDAVSILMIHPTTNDLGYAAGSGFRTSYVSDPSMPFVRDLARRVVAAHQILSIPDLTSLDCPPEYRKMIADEGLRSYHAVPMIVKGTVSGVLEVYQRQMLNPDTEWFDFLETLAGQSAIAMENASLVKNLQNSNLQLTLAYDATIEGWARALEMRDMETEGHSQRVTDLAIIMAVRMGIRGDDLVYVRRGALLHDIGKMGIPDSILQKPGPLTDEEWVIMRKHPVYAHDMLTATHHLYPIVDIPYCHHEKWDGSGYPNGLKGEAIPLAARIFAVIDVWDALTSDRPYRKAWDKEKTLNYINEQTGKHFDPNVIEVFSKVINEIRGDIR